MRVVWIGLGNMGLPMAHNLHSAGFDVTGYDVNPAAVAAAREAGIPVSRTPGEALAGADAVVTMLPAGAFVLDVLESIDLAVTSTDALVVDCSTTSVADARAIHDLVSGHGRRFLDAPVSGGTTGAQAGTLTFMVGSAGDDLTDATPVLEAMGKRILHAGDIGAGQTAKIINNLLLAVNTQVLCEAASIASGLGLDHKVLAEIAGASSGDSWALRQYYPVAGVTETAPSNRAFQGGFATRLMLKDVRLALDAAELAGCTSLSGALVEQQLTRLMDRGLENDDFSRLIDLVGVETGVEARVDAPVGAGVQS